MLIRDHGIVPPRPLLPALLLAALGCAESATPANDAAAGLSCEQAVIEAGAWIEATIADRRACDTDSDCTWWSPEETIPGQRYGLPCWAVRSDFVEELDGLWAAQSDALAERLRLPCDSAVICLPADVLCVEITCTRVGR